MAVRAVSSSVSHSQLEKSYRGWMIRGAGFTDAEIKVVLHGVVTLLRRHSIDGTICSNCDNDDPNQCQVSDVDKLAFITEIQCLVCRESLPTVCRRSKYYLENIDDPSVLRRGDHVGWYRALAYWHHGIVTRQGADSVYMVGYTVSNQDHPAATVTEDEYDHRGIVSLMRGNVYRVVYDDCFTNEYTALRAQRTLGETKYDFFERNDEHTTTWCKTGVQSSSQLESCFTSLGKIALSVLLRSAMLTVLWLLQLCHLTRDLVSDAGRSLSLEKAVSVAYVCLIASGFSIQAIRKGLSRMKSSVRSPADEPRNDFVESFRKRCADAFFRCVCRQHPGCSRLACSACFVACFCCGLCQATWSLCVSKLRVCQHPFCGRQAQPVVSLVVGSVAHELIAAAGPFLVVWFTDDILTYLAGHGIIVSTNEIVNRAVIVIAAIALASIASYLVGIILSRWIQSFIECFGRSPCCGRASKHAEDSAKTHQCPVHHNDVVNHSCVLLPGANDIVTNQLSENCGATVIML